MDDLGKGPLTEIVDKNGNTVAVIGFEIGSDRSKLVLSIYESSHFKKNNGIHDSHILYSFLNEKGFFAKPLDKELTVEDIARIRDFDLLKGSDIVRNAIDFCPEYGEPMRVNICGIRKDILLYKDSSWDVQRIGSLSTFY